jgi:hypothetical protein
MSYQSSGIWERNYEEKTGIYPIKSVGYGFDRHDSPVHLRFVNGPDKKHRKKGEQYGEYT